MSSPADGVELVVLLDEDGLAVDISPKATVHHTETSVPLAFLLLPIFDRHWRLLMTRRALHDEVDEARWVDWAEFRAGGRRWR
jgi:isopentenyl-diphosphate delta-isomerase